MGRGEEMEQMGQKLVNKLHIVKSRTQPFISSWNKHRRLLRYRRMNAYENI